MTREYAWRWTGASRTPERPQMSLPVINPKIRISNLEIRNKHPNSNAPNADTRQAQFPNHKHQGPNKDQITNGKSQTRASLRESSRLLLPPQAGSVTEPSVRPQEQDPRSRITGTSPFGTCCFAVWSLFEIWCFEFVSDFVLRISCFLKGRMFINSKSPHWDLLPTFRSSHSDALTSVSRASMSNGLARQARAPQAIILRTFSGEGWAVIASTSACLVDSCVFISRHTS